MPGGLDGFAVCQAVRRDPTLSGMFIVILTALSGQDVLSRGKNAGADYCLTKPFSPTKLLNLIGARPRNGLVAAI
ncbi:MAG: response regulator, partial [Proteobacteria bacterium]|nr:response regulator [Pseudomonadota bacterium]